MKKDLTELVFILDRSGSMGGLESDTIGGFNGLLAKQKKEKGKALITTVLFDDKYEILHDRVNIKGVNEITDEDYYVRGCTALLDALGKTITKIYNAQHHTAEEEKPQKTMFVIITDGLENASREYTRTAVKRLIDKMQHDNGWEFIFLGANIDAAEEGRSIGISEDRAVNYRADEKGTEVNFEAVCQAVSSVRSRKNLDRKWRETIDRDYESRK